MSNNFLNINTEYSQKKDKISVSSKKNNSYRFNSKELLIEDD